MSKVSEESKSLQWMVWGFLAVVIFGVVVQFAREKRNVDESANVELPVYSTLPEFVLTNQFSNTIQRTDLGGNIWIADVIFTRCAGPCLKMSQQMSELAKLIPTDAPVRFLSLTTDPEYDTPAVLKSYQSKFDLNGEHWTLLTGEMREFAKVVVDGMKLSAQAIAEEDRVDPADLFVHSSRFVLLDAQLQVRGVYSGIDSSDRGRILKDIETLLNKSDP